MAKQSTRTKASPVGDIPACRVVEIGLGDFAECTEWKAVRCAHALPFGYCFLCMHPRVGEMIKNTKQELQAAKI